MAALDKIRVIDFGHYVAGPIAGMILADQGADVIKIDPPEGPRFDTPANATWNRGKRSIALDLKAPKDLAVARDLVAQADVVIENFRPGVMDRLGLGPQEMRSANSTLIYASMPGFGEVDPRSSMPAWEGVVLAAADGFRPIAQYQEMLKELHRKPVDREGVPVFTAEPVASMYAAFLSAINIASALHVCDHTGMGQRVEVPLFDAFLQSIGLFGMTRLPFRPAGRPASTPWNHQYQCADDRWIHVACGQPNHSEALAKALDRPDLLEAGRNGRRMATPSAHYELYSKLDSLFRSESAEHWEQLLIEHRLPGAICRSSAEWLEHPHAKYGDLFIDIDDHNLGRTRQPAPLVELSGSPGKIANSAPRIDQHRKEILAEVSGATNSPRSISSLISPIVGPLDGTRVLDLSINLAGPTCGRTLAELGADVIKIDNPKRNWILYHLDVNRGKRSLLLDLKTEEGKKIFFELVETADVIIENFRPGVAERLGIDYESVQEVNPDVIYASLSAYESDGPWAELPGNEESVEALTGFQVRYGGSEQPALWPYPAINDYATGYAGSLGILLGLLHRNIAGKGQRIVGSLARTSGMLQSMFLLDHADQDWSEPCGPHALGSDPLQCLYRCSDGWVFVGARDASLLLPLLDEQTDLQNRLTRWCGERTCDDAVAELVACDVGAQTLTWFNDAMMEPVVVRRGLSLIRADDRAGLLRTVGPGPWLSHSKVEPGKPASRPGGDAASILAEINRGSEVQKLAAENVISVPPAQRPDREPGPNSSEAEAEVEAEAEE